MPEARRIEDITPAELAKAWACSERRIRETARRLGACLIIGKTMVLTPDDVSRIKFAINADRFKAEAYEAKLEEIAAENERRSANLSQARDAAGYLYFVQCEDRIKIGFTRDVERRLIDIRTMCPFPVRLVKALAGTYEMEAELHKRFAKFRLTGEWFHYAPPIKAYVRSLP